MTRIWIQARYLPEDPEAPSTPRTAMTFDEAAAYAAAVPHPGILPLLGAPETRLPTFQELAALYAEAPWDSIVDFTCIEVTSTIDGDDRTNAAVFDGSLIEATVEDWASLDETTQRASAWASRAAYTPRPLIDLDLLIPEGWVSVEV